MTQAKLTSKAFRFSDSELEVLEKAKEIHGSYKSAVMAGLEKVLTQGRVSKADVIAYVEALPND